MTKRGPRRTVTASERVGSHGNSRWVTRLECGHVIEKPRKFEVGVDKVSCRSCVAKEKSTEVSSSILPDADDPMGEIKLQGSIAAYYGVRLDQVEVGFGMAKIFLDSEDIRKTLSR